MDNQNKNYEVAINSAINIAKLYSMITAFVTFCIIGLNYVYNINKIWNICFLIPLYLIYISSIIQLIICFWKAGKMNGNIEKKVNRKSNLIFSASITYIVFLSVSIIYAILSIILY